MDPIKCTACTDCFAACPVGGVPMDFNFGRSSSKAIFFYSPFPARKALINSQKCEYIIKGKCGEKDVPPCVEVCKPQAIDFLQKPQEIELNVGAVVLACGADEKKSALYEYGYGKYSNVLTSLEFERLLSGLGPTSGVIKKNDGTIPKSIVFINTNNSSSIYFMSLVAEAMGSIEKIQGINVFVIHEDIAFQKDSYEDYYKKSNELGVQYIRIESKGSVKINDEKDGNLNISYINKNKKEENIKADMVVLSTPLNLSKSAKKIIEISGIENKFQQVCTSLEGIYICGNMQSIMGIDDTIIQACSVASHISEVLSSARQSETLLPPKKELMVVNPENEPSIEVVICECGLNIAGLLNIEELVNYTSSLPFVKQVEVTPFGCDGVKVKELLQTKKFNRIVMGACSPKTPWILFSIHCENAGLNRFLLEIVNIRNHCTWVHSKNKTEATEKAKILMKMGVKRASLLEPLEDIIIPINQSCLIIGGNPAGLACASKLANMGFKIYLVKSEIDLYNALDDKSLGKKLMNDLTHRKNIKIYKGSKIGNIKGYIGNYDIEVIAPDEKEQINVGSIAIATNKDMKETETDWEKDLALQRDERNFFIPSIGILNLMDTNTEGVFI